MGALAPCPACSDYTESIVAFLATYVMRDAGIIKSTFNFVMGMLYTQLFQELYRLGRLNVGRLPLDIGFWLDEFANTKMPDDFPRILSTSRSRGIYMTVVLQSLSQIKNMYKDQWERIVSDCHTFINLDGNEKSTHEYTSSMLGKRTIDKFSNSISYGINGSSSKSEDSIGRELLTADENIQVVSMTEEELDQMDMKEKADPLETVQKALQDNIDQINGKDRKQQSSDRRAVEEMSLLEMLKIYDYNEEQRDEIWEGMSQKLSEDVIKGYAKTGNSAAKMKALREMAVGEMAGGR